MPIGTKDGSWRNDAKIAAGVDAVGNEHPLNCDATGTLQVAITGPVASDGDVLVTIDKYTYSYHTELIVTPASLDPVVILSTDTSRKNYTLYNNSVYPLLVGFETPLSSISFSLRIPMHSYFEPPLPQYAGNIYGMWEGGPSGACHATAIY